MQTSSEKLSQIMRDIGQVFFASVFIGPFFGNTLNWTVIISGLILSLIFWSIDLFLIRE
jgi:hypothetical protein